MSTKYEAKKFGYTSIAFAVVVLTFPIESRAYELYNQDGRILNAKVDAVFALMHSDENYATTGTKDSGSSNWREGFIKYGLNGNSKFQNQSSLYGAFSLLSSGTWGDGDAAAVQKAPSGGLQLKMPILAGVLEAFFLVLAKTVLKFQPVAKR